MCIYISIYIYIYICMHIYVYIYKYMYTNLRWFLSQVILLQQIMRKVHPHNTPDVYYLHMK